MAKSDVEVAVTVASLSSESFPDDDLVSASSGRNLKTSELIGSTNTPPREKYEGNILLFDVLYK